MTHILDQIHAGLPDHLPGRTDATVTVTWWVDDPAVLLRLAAQHPFGDLQPGEHIVWYDHGRRLMVQVSYVSDDDDDDGSVVPDRPLPEAASA